MHGARVLGRVVSWCEVEDEGMSFSDGLGSILSVCDLSGA